MLQPGPQAHVDPSTGSLVIESLVTTHPAVLGECRHWSTGRRGEPVDLENLAGSDLSAFAVQALTIGATALTAASGVQQAYGVEALVAEVEQRSTKAASDAADRTSAAVEQASSVLQQTSQQVKQVVTDAGTSVRQVLGESVDGLRRELNQQLTTLLGGEESEVLLRLKPVLETFSRNLQERAVLQTATMVDKVAAQFNPGDPASPMAQQMRALAKMQTTHAQAALEQQRVLADKVDELSRGLAAKRATELALAQTTAKGATYEEQVNELMVEIAAGLGDEYLRTGKVTGLRTRSMKGYGVLEVAGGSVRAVLEMTDSGRSGWCAYLQEAEENRGAQAALGLVRSADQLGGHSIRTFGPRRVVMAFDPEVDDVHLLRCVVQLLRLAAQSAAARADRAEVATADEIIAEAMGTVDKIGKIQKSAGQIRTAASSITTEAEVLRTELVRQLSQARSVLASCAELPAEVA